jgi:hypothetical protein
MTVGNKCALKPRGLSADEAAAYVGVCKTKFLDEVRAGIWPPGDKRKGRVIWDRVLLDRAFDQRSGISKDDGEEAALRALRDARAA